MLADMQVVSLILYNIAMIEKCFEASQYKESELKEVHDALKIVRNKLVTITF